MEGDHAVAVVLLFFVIVVSDDVFSTCTLYIFVLLVAVAVVLVVDSVSHAECFASCYASSLL